MESNLLRPRYEVIADYPDSYLDAGCIVEPIGEYSEVGYSVKIDGGYIVTSIDFDKYPHLFKKLSWWEHRKDEEMPEYLLMGGGEVIKVDEHFKYSNGYSVVDHPNNCLFTDSRDRNMCVHYQFCEPATLSDYEAYLKTK